MKIEIDIAELKYDIRNKSHLDVSVIPDAEARYKVEAGTEKMDEIDRDLVSASAALALLMQRYLRPEFSRIGVNDIALPEKFVYDLAFSERRLAGKAQPLCDAIHSYLVNATLAKVYESVSQPDLATKREKLSAADLQLVEQLIFTKRPPFLNINCYD